jgi:rare lipoprotein A
MRAKLTLRATGAKNTGTNKHGAKKTGALSLTLALVAIPFGTVAAGALAAQSGSAPRAPISTTASLKATHRPGDLRSSIARSRLVVDRDLLASPVGGVVVVHGLLKPVRRGATVKLMTRAGRRWHTLAIGRTGRNGHFGIRYRIRREGASWVRVRFSGNQRLRAASATAGRIVSLAPTVASWYYDAGNTACGFHATYGVANKTLPCGTRVTLSYGGRTVVATVDDRGPYVYGRSFDLNQNTARYLGMWGVGTVFASV